MDPQQSQQFGAAMAGMMGLFFLIWVVAIAFAVFCFWRIFTKAGMAGALSLLLIVPAVGPIIVVCILAFGEWKVVPRPTAYVPPYPPAGGYPPPSGYPPSGGYPPTV